jgi:hypothetical protein
LWVVTSDVPLDTYGPDALERSLRDLDWVARVAVAHEGVVERFARQRTSTTVPMKLFTMFSAPERAIAETRSRSREIASVVRRIAGCEEWGVRVVRRPAAARRPVAHARAASGAAFLAAKKQTRDAAREAAAVAAAAADEAYDELSRLARESRRRNDVPEGAVSPPVLDAAFLVPGAGRARFKAAAKRFAAMTAAAGLDLTITGPWPAYNFVQPETGA